MIKVIGVRFRTAGKVYFFDPAGREIKTGDHVIVETARGIEYGYVVLGTREVEDEKVVQPLKPVIRMATPEDHAIEKKNKEKEKEAFKICLPGMSLAEILQQYYYQTDFVNYVAQFGFPEGHFENTSHGFRPRRSCQTALRSIRNLFTGANWFIEGDPLYSIHICVVYPNQ